MRGFHVPAIVPTPADPTSAGVGWFLVPYPLPFRELVAGALYQLTNEYSYSSKEGNYTKRLEAAELMTIYYGEIMEITQVLQDILTQLEVSNQRALGIQSAIEDMTEDYISEIPAYLAGMNNSLATLAADAQSEEISDALLAIAALL